MTRRQLIDECAEQVNEALDLWRDGGHDMGLPAENVRKALNNLSNAIDLPSDVFLTETDAIRVAATEEG